MPEFRSALEGLGAGVQSGVAIGSQLNQQNMQAKQMLMQKREQEWAKSYQKAALAVQVASMDGLPHAMKAKALNNGLVPIWNNPHFNVEGNNSMPLEGFKPEDFEDKELQDVFKTMKKNGENKELATNPKLLLSANTQLMMDYYTKKGKSKEAMEMQNKIVELGINQEKADREAEQQVATGEDSLRKEFNSLTQDFRVVSSSYQKILDVSKNPSPAGDISLIYGIMKLNDPGSTVREGERADAANAGNVPERIRSAYNKLLTNDGQLSENQRKDFIDQAKALYSGQERMYKRTEATYRGIAKDRNYNPNRVGLGETFTVSADEAVATPKPSTSLGTPTTAEDYLASIMGTNNAGR